MPSATQPKQHNLIPHPSPTKTDAGTYYVWYKVVGDENHYDTDSECIEVKIEEDSSEPDYKSEWVNGQWYDKNGKDDYKPQGCWKKYENGYAAQNEFVRGWWFGQSCEWIYPYRSA